MGFIEMIYFFHIISIQLMDEWWGWNWQIHVFFRNMINDNRQMNEDINNIQCVLCCAVCSIESPKLKCVVVWMQNSIPTYCVLCMNTVTKQNKHPNSMQHRKIFWFIIIHNVSIHLKEKTFHRIYVDGKSLESRMYTKYFSFWTLILST